MNRFGSIDGRLEAGIGDFFWAPEDVHIVDVGYVAFAHSERLDKVYNVVFRTRPRGYDAAAIVGQVLPFHQHTTSYWAVTDLGRTDDLIAALTDAGYKPQQLHYGYSINVEDYLRPQSQSVVVRQVSTREELKALDTVRRDVFDLDGALDDEDIDRELAECTKRNARVSRWLAYLDGEPVGSAGMTLHPDLGLGFLWAGGVLESARGRGVYSGLLRARADWAKENGIKDIGLYARVDTSAPIVEAHGFTRHGAMEYWVK